MRYLGIHNDILIGFSTILKYFIVFLILLYSCFYPMNEFTNKIDALAVLAFSLIALIKSRKNILATIVFSIIFYFNYSIAIGEYLIGGSLSVPFTEVKTVEIYSQAIRILLLFISVVSLFYSAKPLDISKDKLYSRDNIILFYSMLFISIIVLIFGIDRQGPLDVYRVRISPAFEYSKLLFLFMYYFSGNSKFRKYILLSLSFVFIFQDFLYGGRATSVQIIILLLITIWIHKLTFKRIILGILSFGVLTSAIIATYRSVFSLKEISLINILKSLISTYLVSDTATFAYYASATHIAASEVIETQLKLKSLLEFLKSILGFSKSELSNVTIFVSKNYFFNLGGGLLPTYFYFWLGWIGVLIISFIVVLLLNRLFSAKKDLGKLLLYAVVISAPRWYLYSPTTLFRSSLYLVVIFWGLSWIGDRLIRRKI